VLDRRLWTSVHGATQYACVQGDFQAADVDRPVTARLCAYLAQDRDSSMREMFRLQLLWILPIRCSCPLRRLALTRQGRSLEALGRYQWDTARIRRRPHDVQALTSARSGAVASSLSASRAILDWCKRWCRKVPSRSEMAAECRRTPSELACNIDSSTDRSDQTRR